MEQDNTIVRALANTTKLAGKYPWILDIVEVTEEDDWADIISRYIELLRDENRALGGTLYSLEAYRRAGRIGRA